MCVFLNLIFWISAALEAPVHAGRKLMLLVCNHILDELHVDQPHPPQASAPPQCSCKRVCVCVLASLCVSSRTSPTPKLTNLIQMQCVKYTKMDQFMDLFNILWNNVNNIAFLHTYYSPLGRWSKESGSELRAEPSPWPLHLLYNQFGPGGSIPHKSLWEECKVRR